MSIKPPVIEHVHVYGKRDEYCAWPSAAVASDGSIVVAFCRSEEHIGPSGGIFSVRSDDGGHTWSDPVTVYDSVIDDRDIGLTTLDGGREIWAHIWSSFHSETSYRNLDEFSYRPEVLERWIDRVNSPDYLAAEKDLGARAFRTIDGGRSWEQLGPGVDSVHGGVLLPDGSVLVAAYRVNSPKIGVYRGSRSSFTWEKLTDIVSPPLTSSRFGEPHVTLLPSGRVLMMIRSTAVPYNDSSERNTLWMTYSDDAGETWAEAYPVPLWGFPPHLQVLSDGRVLCTYGYRRAPFGQRACISEDGVTWKAENEIIIRDDAENVDLGYPASVEVKPGTILTVYYQSNVEDTPAEMRPPDPDRSKPDIMGSIWRVP